MTGAQRVGSANQFFLVVAGALALLIVLGLALLKLGRSDSGRGVGGSRAADQSADGLATNGDAVFLHCAAGIRLPVEQLVEAYQREYGVAIQVQYGGSNTLLSQIEVGKTGDLYLAADDSYIQLARQKGLVRESIPLARMRPVIAVPKGNPKQIHGIQDLLRDDVTMALGNPDQAAIGKAARALLTASGHWDQLQRHVTQTGVFKPTVPEVANDVKLHSADAAIVWDTTLAMYPDLEAVRTPELDAGTADVAVGVLTHAQAPTQALRFARYLAARDKGLVVFADNGFETVDGDRWAFIPEITFFCGSVNRRAVESVVQQFQQREGVVVNTVYNGCGILTAQMSTIRQQQQNTAFPDIYFACDRYYLDTVEDWFQDDVDVSDTEVVIAVPKGNPANIQSLLDLTKPQTRIAVGQPEQCTIGQLTRQVLQAEGIYDQVMQNVVTQTATSAMLLPTVVTRSVDATLAYATDTLAVSDKVDVIRIPSPAAIAIQPFAIARSSEHKYLAGRLYQSIAESRDLFELAGFHFRLDDVAPTARP